jgi:hypothetical protein
MVSMLRFGGGTGVAFDAAGNRYIADGHLGLVRKLSNGTITTSPMSPPLAFPGDPIRVDSSGNIYDANNNVAGIVPPGCLSSPERLLGGAVFTGGFPENSGRPRGNLDVIGARAAAVTRCKVGDS